eukprot:1188279-Prorocentrum_minimum.AAC.2
MKGLSLLGVETATGLTIRIVSNVDKNVAVRSRFLTAFEGKGFPQEFPYRSKVNNSISISPPITRGRRAIPSRAL